jgi:hypothetical protein
MLLLYAVFVFIYFFLFKFFLGETLGDRLFRERELQPRKMLSAPFGCQY